MSSLPKRVVVVGLGMVGISFVEKLLKYDAKSREYAITVLGEEPYLAYNRVGLTSFFEHRKIENLYLNPAEWYQEAPEGVLNYHVNTKAISINSEEKTVTCANSQVYPYDILVLATGSNAILPRGLPGHDANGVFVYRTITDLNNLIEFADTRAGTNGVVVGGGLLGLEAGKAMLDLERFSKITLLERAQWVLSRQLDADAGKMVIDQVRTLGVDIMLGKSVASIRTDEGSNLAGVVFEDGEEIDCSTLCFAIGVSPRDELARVSGLECAQRGGIIVDDGLKTNIPDVYAIGECASWKGQAYGLIGPGVEMADVLAFNLSQAKLHAPRTFKRPDLSTKLKLLGVDVASFGDCFADTNGPLSLPPKFAKTLRDGNGTILTNGAAAAAAAAAASVQALTYRDPFLNVYKKYIFTKDGKYLLGGMMIGDTKDYVKLVPMVKAMKELDMPPSELILGAKTDGDDGDDLPDEAQICSCHNVTKGDVVAVVKDGSCKDLGSVKSCTKAGTGCGGCMPLVTTIFNKTMAAMGNEVKNYVCPHFDYSRVDLYNIIMVKRLKSLKETMQEVGNDKRSVGCELCKPAVASIMASLWNKHVMDKTTYGLQDTNDRFLGNIQRDGTYSVVPRMSGGEITPDKLLAIAEVAKKYNLYTKITGGQRIDMFGAKKQDLLDIWGQLVAAGMESGHAYAKSLRTVKSCVGSTWCRFGIGDSVGMAVRLEERYKSIRAPHKIKGGVSGCVRECAEAQSKDFGLIATEKGFNIFVGGNGGAKPRHAELLAKDVPTAEVVTILDRYLMFYIRTADKLQRTARWVENLPGGLKYLQEVILDDKLGICASLEAQMKELVDSFFDEWAEAIRTPAIAAKFRQFHNTSDTVPNTEVEQDRDQQRPVLWAGEAATDDFKGLRDRWSSTSWQPVIESSYFDGADEMPNGISATIKRGDTQLAVWRIQGTYYATQQMCPHKRAFILSDGLVGQEPCEKSAKGDANGEDAPSKTTTSPWISCPHHKRNFDLDNGSCKTDDALSIATFPAEARPDGMLYLKLPPVDELDAALGTKKWMVKKGESKAGGPMKELDRRIKFVGIRGKKPGVRPLAGTKMVKPVELMMEGGGCGSAPEW
ncbi:Nitrite reductase [NAD(P)H] [Neonectria punicea]|uniref:Nitrite reductase [NAD(P)H] n=1 Tax=Neonectria punicea TaxID=979145 RepID=A0ABR1GR74_9HYPO